MEGGSFASLLAPARLEPQIGFRRSLTLKPDFPILGSFSAYVWTFADREETFNGKTGGHLYLVDRQL